MIVPSTRQVIYNDNTLQLSHSSTTLMHTWELENAIESFLTTKDGDLSSRTQVSPRHDAHLIGCQKPRTLISSALGILEDALMDDDGEYDMIDPPVQVHNYQVTTSKQTAPSLAPHSEWTRRPLKEQAFRVDSNQPVDVMWVDLRSRGPTLLHRPGQCCHFLRSLLGISHHAHPWGDFDDKEYPVVCLVLPMESLDALISFRTTDACPSYFLHSISRLAIPTRNQEWWKNGLPGNNFLFGDVSEARLLVYRRLPPRDALMVQHPIGHFVPDGCLVESYIIQQEHVVDDEDSDENEFQEIFRPVAPPFISVKQDYNNLLEPILEPENFETIRKEAINIPQWTAWPEKQHYSSKGNSDEPTWTVFPLCHCFPANHVENRKWIDVTCNFVPRTVALLKEHLGDTLRTALFSRLEPETTLEPHTGWEDLANHVYRLHLPLVVPEGDGLCGAWVDGCVETHKEGRPMAFDDSKVHRAFNYAATGERLVLILDLARPGHLPLGTATGGHTDELDKFIDALT